MLMCLRVGEATALTWKDIDFNNKTVRINKTMKRVKDRNDKTENKTKVVLLKPKSKSSERIILMSDEALEAIREYYKRSTFHEDNDFVISSKNRKGVADNTMLLTVRRLIFNAGLNPDGKRNKFSTHYLRHTGISYYIRHGVPIDVVSKFAGHSSIEITQRVYYHVIEEQKQQGLAMMNAISRKKPEDSK